MIQNSIPKNQGPEKEHVWDWREKNYTAEADSDDKLT